MKTFCLLGSLWLTAAVGFSADLARWTPASGSGATLQRDAVPANDYYRRSTITVRLDKPAPAAAWLRLIHPDKGYGLITLAALDATGTRKGIRPQDQWGVARLNTGKARNAVFRLPEGTTTMQIVGLPALSELVVTDAQPAYEVPPMVEPAFHLNRPLDLVMSSGADAGELSGLQDSLATMRNLLPLVRALGFNGVESYVKWNFVETTRGTFDWSFYDAIVAECQKYGLKWFPLLVVGSAYSLPDWFHNSSDHFKYKCLEHGIEIDIPTIFNQGQVPYVQRFLKEFGKHYGSNPSLLGVRLGPSANYGEAQYPATGALGFRTNQIHTHLGYWVGDADAAKVFRAWLRQRYASINDLNAAWGDAKYASFDEVKPFLPITALNYRMRKDFATWYMDAMTRWCERWAEWAREAMPNVSIYQSSGGWGAVEIGTDYVAHTKTMARLHGGIRMTNENDSYVNNFCVTRPAASAARFYGAKFGTEPAGFGTRRGVMNRLFNIIGNNGQHLFYYNSNLYDNDQAIDGWLKYAPLLDQRAQPATEVAALYPETANQVDDSVMRHLGASSFFNAAYQMRSLMDYDLMGEQMILDGALEHYRVLVFLVGKVMEKTALDRVDQWVRSGGVVLFPVREGSRTPPLTTVEGDSSVYQRWQKGDTGKGKALLYTWHPDTKHYLAYVKQQLRGIQSIRPEVRGALAMQKPEETYWSVLESGKLVLLNYGDEVANIRLADGTTLRVEPYSIEIR